MAVRPNVDAVASFPPGIVSMQGSTALFYAYEVGNIAMMEISIEWTDSQRE